LRRRLVPQALPTFLRVVDSQFQNNFMFFHAALVREAKVNLGWFDTILQKADYDMIAAILTLQDLQSALAEPVAVVGETYTCDLTEITGTRHAPTPCCF
jgi:hypothetical protein